MPPNPQRCTSKLTLHAAGRDVRRGRFDASRTNLRRAAFTVRAVGKASATSGSSMTMFEPCAYRVAYFPRTLSLKSYSARIVLTSRTRLGVF